jgi:hypothetical protein
VDASSDHTNLVWIHDWDNAGTIRRLEKAQSLGKRAVVVLTPQFFGPNFSPLSDAQQNANWDAFSKQLRPYKGSIAAFYPADEPYLHVANIGGVDAMSTYLASVNRKIKKQFPGIPIAVIFSWLEIQKGYTPPAGFNWLGVDCYGSFDQCNGWSIPAYYEWLKKRMSSNQKLFLVPDANFPRDEFNGSSEAGVIERANQYLNYAQKETRVVAVIPFIWQSFCDRPDPKAPYDFFSPNASACFRGLNLMPSAKKRYQAIGKSIVSAASSCRSLSFRSGKSSATTLKPGQKFTVSCDYGAVVDAILPGIKEGKLSCAGTSYAGTAAQFSCSSPSAAGSYTLTCNLVAGTNDHVCAQSNTVTQVTVQ